MQSLNLLRLQLLLYVVCAEPHKKCFPGCYCETESFGLFDSFSLTKVDCRGVGPHLTPIPIPLDTSYLDLSSSNLKTLGEAMLTGPGYTTLVSLDLSYNQITEFEANTFSKLRYLESLDLSHNSLQSLQDGSFSNPSLEDIDISNNRLQEINLNIFMPKIHGKPINIDLSNNEIRSVVNGLNENIPFIQGFNLSGNRLTSVPNLKGFLLRYLSLDNNPITKIEENAFSGMVELTHLSLANLPTLTEIASNSFSGLSALQVLDLSGNPQLKALYAEVFSGLLSLQELNLSNTAVNMLPQNILQYLPSVKTITLGNNTRCFKTVRNGQFHRQLGVTKTGMVLKCYNQTKPDVMSHII
ncbi:tsukushi [Protopterus annectens]|uniref:tsukushi n=1 Tax=Protopterus annectens TaxID=7888 RepID=UPI001CFA1EE9|nr:tsukushi [Protopterus annectens]XP_043929292.1 tsukushi [Protopterus annectens]XP_043929293.1 tsukushi [Protopterus annectens]XP_043929294.1 tsukushi [Protopterus annectens]